ncbi:tetrapyrrole biosynthesis, uroporphyrinogen III synthase [Didymella exigua CBS 183.55]|uniref:Tetrapyrrole biosynthesis, uroporphyrinogen III synthase n=1 Tax=Didymella exigua CBS 183.55 TaxID=1150837 RepID=A0A6A5RUF6_9PLEO|nr:tetrapyrrole biosynthesis, uroporphyrinogen III synthase [Didymella exigua CBS 183.55]KAF1931482.1 tetrapyrrole biosynthesis, uroporphyrinogen III synthase [Didymella exigua CBS 183.55]
MAELSRGRVPILFLKTKSVPTDTYEELFSTCDNNQYAPVFVPVLEHRFKRDALDNVRQHILNRGLVPTSQNGLATYGALIFTSQRAVEAFNEVVEGIREEGVHPVDELLPESLPLYVVGPATARGLRALDLRCPILGEETGNGEALAGFILEHYNTLYPHVSNPPILFMVGDKRRDIIPKTLQSEKLPSDKSARVNELVIYETGEMQSFKTDFTRIWQKNAGSGSTRQWIVVFSPTGCQALLESLNLLDAATGKSKKDNGSRDTRIVTIGPTTRDYLITEFDFTPDVVAQKPSPEGIAEGIRAYLRSQLSVHPTDSSTVLSQFYPSHTGYITVMAATRSSTHNGSDTSSPAKNNDAAVAGAKRKAEADVDAGTSPKRGRKAPKNQPTIDSMLEHEDNTKADNDAEMREAAQDVVKDAENETDEIKSSEQPLKDKSENATKEEDTDQKDTNDQEGGGKTKPSSNNKPEQAVAKVETNGDGATKSSSDNKVEQVVAKPETNGDGAIELSSQREKKMPSNILEKGVIYFFTRNRVSVDEAESVGDLQRTFFVLRPIPAGARLGDGAVQDLKNNRLFALPKKVFPKSHNDRFMAFVEKANTSIQDLKDNFFQGSEYNTQTQGTRRNDPVTPVAEGVYLITRTDDATTHLVYSTTIPSEMGEVQEDLGIKDQGSFVISVKNPERSGPANASLPQKPDFSKEIIEEFRGLAWSEVKPKYLDHEYCQILLIGEDTDKAVEATKKNERHGKATAKEEIEQLEHEDEVRVQHLKGDDSVFEDLKISKDDYPKVPTTW